MAGIVLSAACVGCSSGQPPGPTGATSTQPTASAAVPPSSSGELADYAEPGTVEGELARARFEILDEVPTTTSDVRAPLASGEAVLIEGQCTGGTSLRFALLSATPGDDGNTLLEGTIDCGQPPNTGLSYQLPEAGQVQLTLAADEDVTDAWVLARQP